mmetsp:Transcript_12117/g.31031  ORF Transcript_12117/g.31031 Transcript_12117/m.31031 type:complete len:339 (+) Transcript_12117:52-1068(+)
MNECRSAAPPTGSEACLLRLPSHQRRLGLVKLDDVLVRLRVAGQPRLRRLAHLRIHLGPVDGGAGRGGCVRQGGGQLGVAAGRAGGCSGRPLGAPAVAPRGALLGGAQRGGARGGGGGGGRGGGPPVLAQLPCAHLLPQHDAHPLLKVLLQLGAALLQQHLQVLDLRLELPQLRKRLLVARLLALDAQLCLLLLRVARLVRAVAVRPAADSPLDTPLLDERLELVDALLVAIHLAAQRLGELVLLLQQRLVLLDHLVLAVALAEQLEGFVAVLQQLRVSQHVHKLIASAAGGRLLGGGARGLPPGLLGRPARQGLSGGRHTRCGSAGGRPCAAGPASW